MIVSAIVHQKTQYGCLAAVAAMITGEPLEVVNLAIGHDGSERPFSFLEVAAFLNSRGFHLGAYSKDIDWPLINWSLVYPALLFTVSSVVNGAHAVLWDGDKVLDPEESNAGKGLKDYNVQAIWPIAEVI